MHPTDSLDPHRCTEALVFEIPEVPASARMASATSECCARLGIDLTRVDAWENPEAVRAHGILVGPTIVLLVDGVEVARLVGPRSCRRVTRFFDSAGVGTPRTLVAV